MGAHSNLSHSNLVTGPEGQSSQLRGCLATPPPTREAMAGVRASAVFCVKKCGQWLLCYSLQLQVKVPKFG